MASSTRNHERNAEIIRRKLRGESYATISKNMDVTYPRIVDIARSEHARLLKLWDSGEKTGVDLASEYSLTVAEVTEILARETSRNEERKAYQNYEDQICQAEADEHDNGRDLEDHWEEISRCPSTLRQALLFDGQAVFIGSRLSSKTPWLHEQEPVSPLYWMRIPGPPKRCK